LRLHVYSPLLPLFSSVLRSTQRETYQDGTVMITNLSVEHRPIETTIIKPDGSKRRIQSQKRIPFSSDTSPSHHDNALDAAQESPWGRRPPPEKEAKDTTKTKEMRLLGVDDDEDMKNRKALLTLGVAGATMEESQAYDKALRTLGEDASAIALSKSELIEPRSRADTLEEPMAIRRRGLSSAKTQIITSTEHDWVKPNNRSHFDPIIEDGSFHLHMC
jgi:hypothetical protein